MTLFGHSRDTLRISVFHAKLQFHEDEFDMHETCENEHLGALEPGEGLTLETLAFESLYGD